MLKYDGVLDKCEIICVGTELLIGSTLNTNANTIALALADNGLYCYWQTVVGDNVDRLSDQIRTSISRSDLVIFSGGLGPTEDDLTMETACMCCDREMVFDQESYDRMEKVFATSGRKFSKNNIKQAMLPKDSVVLPNDNGTAPGACFVTKVNENHSCVLAFLPGPPSELGIMLNKYLIPELKPYTLHSLRNEYVHIIGIGESKAETMISDLIKNQTNPSIAPYASEGECMFRVSQSVDEDSKGEDLITPIIDKMRMTFGDHIYEVGQRSLREVVLDMLVSKNLHCAFAESLTGGMISSGIVDISGASSVFEGGIVTYSNESKVNLLGVSPQTLSDYGAVSKECAKEMAIGVLKAMNADVAISVTGIAGPDGGSASKPVGTVYIGFASHDKCDSIEFHISGNRMRVRKVTALKAFDYLRMLLLRGHYYEEE
ncbi:MAG TPA: competence/damage-inducible protein A [Saccharofermentans sp.]|jgi:nicotinamide-nucleotide amidase|nr:competence/damage-inducible protein A [Clostridia bacterium]HRV50129.1 competence/damage-inducible protein A [Saccharofermentans sp.]HUM23960.1 competence/damage-inducible protein A [Saccharofermentans sp.]